jgi:enoyl-CoA hydratase/carnithine racemase
MEQRIRVTMTDGVADVQLSRPDKMNALDKAMFDALVETGSRLVRQQGLRVVVLSGEGRAFCAGLDTGRFAQMADPSPQWSHSRQAIRAGRTAYRAAGFAIET